MRAKDVLGSLVCWLITFATIVWCHPTRAQDKYAIVIGVETYDTSIFNNLDYASEDAEDMGQALERLGFNTTVMTSESRSQKLRPTTPAKVNDVIKSVTASCSNEDTLLITLSGHGVQFSDEELTASGVRETYFCPSEASLSDKSSMVKISSLVNLMNSAPASRKLLLVDACQEQVLSTEGKKKGAKRIELGSVHESRRSVPGGLAVLFSCSSGQFSWEHPSIGHSVFSYHVIEYLNGKAEQRFYDSDQIDLNGLVFFVSKRTNDYVIGKNLSADGQLPVLRGSSANWALGKVPSQARKFINSVGIEMVWIPAGKFGMGMTEDERRIRQSFTIADMPDALPVHQVEISKPFYMSSTEVTTEQWKKVMGKAPTTNLPKDDPLLPASVTWNDATAFCGVLSKTESQTYRLPTEAEWEYCCRAGSRTLFSFGNEFDIGKANFWDDPGRFGGSKPGVSIRQGRTYAPNVWGLYDMHGNQWEWCADWFSEDYYKTSPKIDPLGPATGDRKVIRGGCFGNSYIQGSSASRSGMPPNEPPGIAIRLVLVPR